MREQFVAKTFEIAPGLDDFYMDTFSNCIFILKDGDPRFLMCDFIDCTFVPPYVEAEKVNPKWENLMAGCVVMGPRTRTLLKPDEAKPKLKLADGAKWCRVHADQICYLPDRCVFNCTRDSEGRGK